MNVGVGIITFCILGIIFLSADNQRLKEELRRDRENPDEELLKQLRDAGLLILHPILFHLPHEG